MKTKFDETSISNAFSLKINTNIVSIIHGLKAYGVDVGLDKPHRLADYLANLAHETGRFRYDREVWGPTPAQLRYEGRIDLGNTVKGDGYKFRGRTPIQITGRANTQTFYNWCKSRFKDTPNFIDYPDLMNTDPWEGLGPIWYWGFARGSRHNELSDRGDFVGVVKLINGGTNGLRDRYLEYGRIALFLLGSKETVRQFQKRNKLIEDGIVGKDTHYLMFKELQKMDTVIFNDFKAETIGFFNKIMSIIKKLFGGK